MRRCDTERIKQSVNLINFILKRVKLHKVGSVYQGLCPFHGERNPSFTVFPDKQSWFCFGCGARGDVFDFVRLYYNVDFKEALRMVCEEEGIQTHTYICLSPKLQKLQKVKNGNKNKGLQNSDSKPHLQKLQKDNENNDLQNEQCKKASDDICDAVYRELLDHLFLSYEHATNLKQRGLPDNEIKRRGYKTLPVDPFTRQNIAQRLYRLFGDEVFMVPGIVKRKTQTGREYVTIAGHAGLLIPVRNLKGQIIALKVRLDDAEASGGKYRWITSAKDGGVSAGNPCHVPLPLEGIEHAKDVIRVTEGELKADIATVLDPAHIFTVAIPGVNAWQGIISVLEALKPKRVLIAFDKDTHTNHAVVKAFIALDKELATRGFEVGGETW
jgi:hypothetical protein